MLFLDETLDPVLRGFGPLVKVVRSLPGRDVQVALP